MRRARGTIHVFTFKDGVLSAVAHDLRLRLESFEVALDGELLRADFDLESLHVDGPIEGGVLRAEAYDANKRADVEKAMHGDVLRTAKHPRAHFIGTARSAVGAGFRVEGELELAGKKQPLAFDVSNTNGTYNAHFELRPSQWGIAQYKALLGTIRLKDVVRVELALTET